jgi:hypothetical protein
MVSIPAPRASGAETLIGRACQQPRFAVSDVRCSRRTTRVTGWPGSGRRLASSSNDGDGDLGGDDDEEAECDVAFPGEGGPGDEDFYADVLESS